MLKQTYLILVFMFVSIFTFEKSFADRLFSSDSPWNVEIKSEERNALYGIKPLEAIVESGKSVILNTRLWTTTIVTARQDSPRHDVTWSSWGVKEVPIPQEVFDAISYLRKYGDTDRNLCIVDGFQGVLYSFWAPDYHKLGSGISVKAGGVFATNGSGWWDNSLGPWAGRAAGASTCGGVITPEEMALGEIDHALSAGWPKMMVRSRKLAGAKVYPAKTTDGRGMDYETTLPLGARLQLHPDLTVEKMKQIGLKSGDIVIAKAMQKYGVYLVDSSETFCIYFQSDLGKTVYHDITSPWPKEIMKYFSVTHPVDAKSTSPLESRLSRSDVYRSK